MRDSQPKNRDEIIRTFQIGENGISVDYHNESNIIIRHINSVLKRPGSDMYYSEAESRDVILRRMKSFRSYSDFMNSKDKINGMGLADFLTARGREIAARLDEIAAGIKSFITEDPQEINTARVLELLEESRDLLPTKLIYDTSSED